MNTTFCKQDRRSILLLELAWRQIHLFATTMNQLDSSPESRMWAMLAHLSSLSGFIIPFGNIIGPLVIWLIKRDEMTFVDDQAKEALNFNISMTIYGLISAVLVIVVVGFLMLAVLGIAWLVLAIMAAIKANEGVAYRYPLTLRLVK